VSRAAVAVVHLLHLRELGLLVGSEQRSELGLELLVESLELLLGGIGRQDLLTDLVGIGVDAVAASGSAKSCPTHLFSMEGFVR
jgi:hypothetical protein